MTSSNVSVIGVTGMPGSGKSAFAEIAKQFGYQIVVMGDVIRAEVIKRGFEPSPEATRKVMIQLREEYGEEVVALLTCKAIDEIIAKKEKKIVIDGIRSPVEVDYFKKHIGKNFVIIAIHVDPIIRFQRLRERGREDAPNTEEEFKIRDEAELNLGLGSTIAFSNYIISNNKSIDDLREQTLALLKDLEKEEE
ncbi:MAG: AAA family ATPase [Candidatus Heimdallarchaeaceae archaeon]